MNIYNGEIILISGGAGAIGSNLSRKFAESGAAKVIILDDLSASYKWNIPNLPNILFVKGSITNDNDLKLMFHEKSTYIFHLEAFFVNQNSADFPEKDLMVGQLETTKLLEHCLLLRGAKQFVYADSGCAIFWALAPLLLESYFVFLHLSSLYQISQMS